MNKGISPLIATVLLIAFVLAVAGVVGGWLTTITRTGTTEIGRGFALQVNCTKAAVDIVDVICINTASTSSNVTITVTNNGPVSLSSPQFYFRAASEDTCTGSSSDSIGAGATAIFRINCTAVNSLWTSADTLQFARVSTNCQNQVAISMDKDNINSLCT